MGSVVNPAFNIGREVGQNAGTAFRESKDNLAIEGILSEAMQAGDPNQLQNSIGKILSQVSPERQQTAIQYLESAMSNISKRQDQQKQENIQQQAAKDAGYTYGAPPAVQAQQARDSAKSQRLSAFGMGQPQGGRAMGQGAQMQPQGGGAQGSQMQQGGAGGQGAQMQQGGNPQDDGNSFARFTEGELILLTGHPDREVSEPAKQDLRRRQARDKAKSAFEPESDKLEAKRVAQYATEIEDNYKAALNQDARDSRMKKLDEKGNLTGPGKVKFMEFLGFPIGAFGNRDTEEYRKLEAETVKDIGKVFPGGKITNFMIEAYIKTIPTLMNSQEGRAAIQRNRGIESEAKKVRYREYEKIIKENGGRKPPNLSMIVEERVAEKIAALEDELINGMETETNKFQQPVEMIAPDGSLVDIPANMIEKALQNGAKFK